MSEPAESAAETAHSSRTQQTMSTNDQSTEPTLKAGPRVARKLKNESNYSTWKTEVTRCLTIIDLDEYPDGRKTKPLLNATAQRAWTKNDAKALQFINESCEEDPQGLIAGCMTSKETWDSLKTHFEGKTRTNIPHLANALDTKFDDRAETIDEHITKFEKRWTALKQVVAGETPGNTSLAASLHYYTMCDNTKAAKLLGTLPRTQHYNNIVDSLTTKEDTLTFANVALRLRETGGQKSTKTSGTNGDSTTAAVFSTTQRKFCGYCKGLGFPGTSHNESECRTKRKNANKVSAQATEETAEENEPEWAFPPGPAHDAQSWAIDCGCTTHITPFLTDVYDAVPYTGTLSLTVGEEATVSHIGKAMVHGIYLPRVLVVPNAVRRLISWGTLQQNGGRMLLTPEKMIIIINGTEHPLVERGKFFYFERDEAHSVKTWHERYAHLPIPAFKHIPEAPKNLHRIPYQCEVCAIVKATKPPAKAYGKIRSTRIGELIYSDVCGPIPVESHRGNKYFVSMRDDKSQLSAATATKTKAEAGKALLRLIKSFETAFDCKVAVLQTDYGGEFQSKEFKDELGKSGIIQKPTVAGHSETNAVPERFNRTMHNMNRAALRGSGMPNKYWELALEYSVYMKNRIPHRSLNGKCPLEVAKPHLDMSEERKFFRPFGEPVFAHTYNNGKLANKAEKARIVGYTTSHDLYKVMLESKKITMAKHPVPRRKD